MCNIKAMRKLAKTLTYSIMHVTVAVMVAYALTGNIYVALGIGLIEPAVQTFFFFMHETAWERSDFLKPAPAHASSRQIYS